MFIGGGDGDDKITKLPVRFKLPPGEEGRALKVVDPYGRDECNHMWFWNGSRMVNVTYLIRAGETEVECSNCEKKLDPMWVLTKIANKESQWNRSRERYLDEMKRLKERSKTRCLKCGYMTPISKAKPKSAINP